MPQCTQTGTHAAPRGTAQDPRQLGNRASSVGGPWLAQGGLLGLQSMSTPLDHPHQSKTGVQQAPFQKLEPLVRHESEGDGVAEAWRIVAVRG